MTEQTQLGAPSAWLHTIHMELNQTMTRLTDSPENPWGKPGRDYSAEYEVTSEPLYKGAALPQAPAEAGEPVETGNGPLYDLVAFLRPEFREETKLHLARRTSDLLRAQPQAREDAQPVASAYRVRPEMNDPEEWTLMHPERAFDYLDRPGWETQPLYTHPAPDAMRVDPVPVTIFCPRCRAPHIDEGEWATTRRHKTHQCQGCGYEWRPFPFPTVGVRPPNPEAKHLRVVLKRVRDTLSSVAAGARQHVNGPALALQIRAIDESLKETSHVEET